MNTTISSKPTIIQYFSVLQGAGGGGHVIAAIARELVTHGYKTMLVVGTPVNLKMDYARMLQKMNIPVYGVNRAHTNIISFVLSIPVWLLCIIGFVPYKIIKRLHVKAAWHRLKNELGYTLRGKIIAGWAKLATIKFLEKAIANESSILHIHYLGWPKCIDVLKWAKEKDISTVLHYHNDVSYLTIKNHKAFYNQLDTFLPYRASIIVLSNSLKQAMTKQIGSGYSIKVVPNWIEDGNIEIENRTDNPFTICTVARNVGGKGIEDFIRAVVLLAEEQIDIRATVIGSGKGHDYLVDMALRLGVIDRITFTGELTEKQVTEELKKAHVFILASSTEGLPIVLLKAMALGLPVIVTPVGANKDIVENAENGFLVEIGNVGQISSCIKKLVDDLNLRNKMGKQSRIYFEQHFTGKVVWPLLENVYTQLMKLK
jgi:glycosyltransferase involved in cell wall biosynthesis